MGRKRDSVFLVFEYCEHDMAVLLDSMPRPFSESEVKCIMVQLLQVRVYPPHCESIVWSELTVYRSPRGRSTQYTVHSTRYTHR